MKALRFLVRLFITVNFFLFFGLFFLYKKYGNKNYKISGKTVIISNHFSDFDMIYIYMLYGFKKHLTFVAFEGIKTGLSKIFYFAYDCIIVYDDMLSNVNSIKQMINVLENDGIIVIFPEGFIDRDKESIYHFEQSYLLIANNSNSKILPLSMFPIQKFLKITKIFVGQEISSDIIKSSNRKELNEMIENQIEANLRAIGVDLRNTKTDSYFY